MRRSTFLVLVLAGTLVAVPASAQQSGEQQAEKLFNDAITLVSAGKYPEARPKFEESQRLDPALGTQFNLADCYEHTGKKGSARRLFGEVADAAKAAGKSEREKTSRERAAALEASAPRLTINVPPSAAALRLDRRRRAPLPAARWKLAQFLDAGMHTVATSAPGKKTFETKVALQDGKAMDVKIPEPEDEPVAPSLRREGNAAGDNAGAGGGQRRRGIIVGAVGVAGLVVGAGAGVFSLIEHGQAKDLLFELQLVSQRRRA